MDDATRATELMNAIRGCPGVLVSIEPPHAGFAGGILFRLPDGEIYLIQGPLADSVHTLEEIAARLGLSAPGGPAGPV